MTDNYEYTKSNEAQTEGMYSPYTDKQYNNYVNDINSGVYTNNGLSLVQFDLSSIYNSSKFMDCGDLFLVMPITMVAAFSTGANNGTLVAPAEGNVNLLSMKNNFIHLIHQAELSINGKTAEDSQPFINIAKHFQMLSEMSTGDLKTVGYSLGMSDVDNWKSKVYNAATSTAIVSTKSGNGMTNNRPFTTDTVVGGATDSITSTAKQFARVANTGIQKRLGRYIDASGGGSDNGIFGATTATISSADQLNKDYTPTYQVVNTNYMVWYDYAVVKLSTVFESLNSIGLTRKADIFMRLYVNTGTLNVKVVSPGLTTVGYSITTDQNSFNNTCPFTVNYLNAIPANGGIPLTVANITAGLYLAKPPATSFNQVNLQLSQASHPLPACRIYYSQITIQPDLALDYISNNRAKTCIFRSILTNQYNNIASGGNFNQLISSGVVHPTGILIVPYVSSQASFSLGDFAWKSPFDTAPADAHPLSLTSLQVTIGGQNVLQSVLNYNYENFLEQLMYAEQLTSADFGITTGLFDASYWNYNRFYWVNVERSNITDKLQPRNLNISFTNNNNVPIDVLVFTFKSNQLTLDVETGIVSIP